MDLLILSSLSNNSTSYIELKNKVNKTIDIKNMGLALRQKIILEKKNIHTKIDILENKIDRYKILYKKYNKNTEKSLFNIEKLISKYDTNCITKLILKRDNMVSILVLIDNKIKEYKVLDKNKITNLEKKKQILDKINDKKIENIMLIDHYDKYENINSKNITDLNILEELETDKDNITLQIDKLLSIINNNTEINDKLTEKNNVIENTIENLKSFSNIKNFKDIKEKILLYKNEIMKSKNKIELLNKVNIIEPVQQSADIDRLKILESKKKNLEKKIFNSKFNSSQFNTELLLIKNNINSLKFLLKRKNNEKIEASNIFSQETQLNIDQEKDKINRYENEIVRLRSELSNKDNILNNNYTNLEKNRTTILELNDTNNNYRNQIEEYKIKLKTTEDQILVYKKKKIDNEKTLKDNSNICKNKITINNIVDNLIKLEIKKIDIEFKVNIDYKNKIADLETIKIDIQNNINQINYNILILESDMKYLNINKDILNIEQNKIVNNSNDKNSDIIFKINDFKKEILNLHEKLKNLNIEEKNLEQKMLVLDMF